MPDLLVTRYVTLQYDPSRKLVRYVRTAEPLPVTEDMEATFAAIRGAVEPFDGRRVGLLVDMRAAPGRNDAEFERKLEPWRRALFERFDRVSVLVRTAAGKLQVARLGATAGRPVSVFTEEAEAIAHLAPEAPAPPLKAAR